MLSIQRLEIQNVGGIENLELTFSDGVNLICGPNGIGKTTILECIGQGFSQTLDPLLRKRAGSEMGEFKITAKAGDGTLTIENPVEHFYPIIARKYTQGAGNWEKSVITLKTNRTFGYTEVISLEKDPSEDNRHRTLGSRGIDFNDIKNWFINRFMFSAHEDALSLEQRRNLELAKDSFSLLDPSVKFSSVVPSSFDIIVTTPNGEIYFEYLSSGFKSSLCLVLGLIKEIEYRFSRPFVAADEFQGVVVIDELDLHLHPEWQSSLIRLIKGIFPNVQLIGATHSPHMIQSVGASELIALEATPNGNVVRRSIPTSARGFQGWTIEEILQDVMGMTDTRSELYRAIEERFENAISNNNEFAAKAAYKEIEEFLHPESIQRKLFRLQFGRIVTDTND